MRRFILIFVMSVMVLVTIANATEPLLSVQQAQGQKQQQGQIQSQGQSQGQSSLNINQSSQGQSLFNSPTTTTSASIENLSASTGPTSASSAIENLSASTGPTSANISLNQTFEASKIPREHIQAGGLPVAPLMQNFGPFQERSWNVVGIIGKMKYTRKEAEAMLRGEKSVETQSIQYEQEKYKPTQEVTIVMGNTVPLSEELGKIVVHATSSRDNSWRVLGRALLDVMNMGGNVLYLWWNGADVDNRGLSGSFSISDALGLIAGGAGRAATTGLFGAGITAGKVGLKFYPYVQGLALKDGVLPSPPQASPPKIKLQPGEVKKEFKEQTTTKP